MGVNRDTLAAIRVAGLEVSNCAATGSRSCPSFLGRRRSPLPESDPTEALASSRNCRVDAARASDLE